MKKLPFLKTFLVLCVLTFSVSAFAGEEPSTVERFDAPAKNIVIVKSDDAKNDDGGKEDGTPPNSMRGVWDG